MQLSLKELQELIINKKVTIAKKDLGRFGVLYLCNYNGYTFSQWETIEDLFSDMKKMGWVNEKPWKLDQTSYPFTGQTNEFLYTRAARWT